MADRPATPPRATRSAGRLPPNPPTPEQIRRMEEARLRAKAQAQQIQAQQIHAQQSQAQQSQASRPPPAPVAGTKRAYSSLTSSTTPTQSRNATASSSSAQPPAGFTQPPSNAYLHQSKSKDIKRSDFIDYDFSTMTDTKAGFLTTTDDPHNRAMWTGKGREEQKPDGITLAEWEREQVRKKLRDARAGPYEPGISILNAVDGKHSAADSDAALLDDADAAEAAEIAAGTYKGRYNDGKKDTPGQCRECASLEIDHKWASTFHISVCSRCKTSLPDKYSLLTKTEARDDYLLTNPELADEDLLPHLERPNPLKHSFHNMQLFLRLQVEAYAFSPAKWGGPAALDDEYARRTAVAKQRKEKKFRNKLDELKKRTRVEAYKRARLGGEGDVAFGQAIRGRYDRHEHEWGRGVTDPQTGVETKTCVECGMEVDELEF